MYENETYESILNRILERMPATVDKRESSFLYNAAAPIAVELQNMYIALDNILNITFFDTADREGKLKRCMERGIDISQFDATSAVCKLSVIPNTLEIPVGTRFSYGDINFVVTEKITDGSYFVKCETTGTVGNVTGDVTPIEYIEGLEKCTILQIYKWGEDDSEISQIDEAYYASLHSQAFGGNRRDYIEKMKSIDGVGGVKVYTAAEWKGGGTCKLVFSTSGHTKPSEEFVATIQEQIDPLESRGAGYGIAPIGHAVTVAGVSEETVSVSMKLTYQPGYTWQDVSEYVTRAIDKYFELLNANWDSVENIIVRISQIEAQVLDVAGVIDISEVMLNDSTANVTIEKDSIVKRGDINAK